MEIDIVDHQNEVLLPSEWITLYHHAAQCALPWVREKELPCSVWDSIENFEVAFVDQRQSAQAHVDFMAVEGATDVITFAHGELVICPAIAEAQAREYGEPLARELLRYLIHGMLHLAGYEDEEIESRQQMERVQEEIVRRLADRLVFPSNSEQTGGKWGK